MQLHSNLNDHVGHNERGNSMGTNYSFEQDLKTLQGCETSTIGGSFDSDYQELNSLHSGSKPSSKYTMNELGISPDKSSSVILEQSIDASDDTMIGESTQPVVAATSQRPKLIKATGSSLSSIKGTFTKVQASFQKKKNPFSLFKKRILPGKRGKSLKDKDLQSEKAVKDEKFTDNDVIGTHKGDISAISVIDEPNIPANRQPNSSAVNEARIQEDGYQETNSANFIPVIKTVDNDLYSDSQHSRSASGQLAMHDNSVSNFDPISAQEDKSNFGDDVLDEKRKSSTVEAQSMAAKLQDLLVKWDVPEENWKLPTFIANKPDDNSSERLNNGTNPESDKLLADPFLYSRLITELRDAFIKNESSIEVVHDRIQRFGRETKRTLDVLDEKVAQVEKEMQTFRTSIAKKELVMKRTLQNYKEDMDTEVRAKVGKQLESREQHYYSLMTRIRSQIDDISSSMENNRMLEHLLHACLQMAISAVGTFAHLMSMGAGIAIYPLKCIHTFISTRLGEEKKQ